MKFNEFSEGMGGLQTWAHGEGLTTTTIAMSKSPYIKPELTEIELGGFIQGGTDFNTESNGGSLAS